MARLRLLCLLPGLLVACQPAAKPTPPQLRLLEGTWLHSREEDQGETLVFRPNTYSFRPARRKGYEFGPYGRFKEYDPAPTTGLECESGTWSAHKNKVHIQLADSTTAAIELEILALSKQRLLLRRPKAK